MRRSTARGARAAAGALVWIGGLYALPLLHNVDHRPDHSHGGTTSPHSHSRGPDAGHAHSRSHETPPSSDHGRAPLDPEHGEGSLLHFASVIVGARPAVLPKLSYTFAPVSVAPIRSADTPARFTFFARGPPSL